MKWIHADSSYDAYFGGKEAVDALNVAWRDRIKSAPCAPNLNFPDIIYNIEKNGFFVWRNAYDPALAAQLKAEADRWFDSGENLKLSDSHYKMVSEPFLNTPTALKLGFDDKLIGVGQAYFGCEPGIGTINLRRSLITDLPPTSTGLFHSDRGNSLRFWKAFFYLNPVTSIEDGPFCIVRGSQNKKFAGWTDKYRFSIDEMREIYGEENLVPVFANPGDIIFGNTIAFHAGLQPKRQERTMLTINVCVHKEHNGTAKIARADYDALPVSKKRFADFLDIL